MSRENPFGVDVFIDTAPTKENPSNREIKVRPENREQAEEIMETARKERAEFLEESATSRWTRLYGYILKSSIPNQIPIVGSVKVLTEAALKKTVAGKSLSGKERMFHSIAGASGFATWGALGIDRLADTSLTKYGIPISIASTVLIALTSEKGKNFIRETLAYAEKQALTAKDALVVRSAEFFGAVNMVLKDLDITEISEEYRKNLILNLQQVNNE